VPRRIGSLPVRLGDLAFGLRHGFRLFRMLF
jgi:hypothetical protein